MSCCVISNPVTTIADAYDEILQEIQFPVFVFAHLCNWICRGSWVAAAGGAVNTMENRVELGER